LGYAMSPIGKYVWATRITVSDVSSTSSPSSVSSSSPSSTSSSPSSDIPAPPTSVSATGFIAGQARINFYGSTYATTYEYWYNTVNNSATATKGATNPGASWYAGGLYYSLSTYPDCNMTIYFWMKSVGASGTSGFSSMASCKVSCPSL